MKPRAADDYAQVDEIAWQAFPEAFSEGGIRWKLLHVSPEVGAWTAIFDCPKGSAFARHVHLGPGEYLLTKGKMEVRGGKEKGGATALAPAYGYEACNARHDRTYFPVASAFYMTFLGPLHFIEQDGATRAVVDWEQVQALWASQIAAAGKPGKTGAARQTARPLSPRPSRPAPPGSLPPGAPRPAARIRSSRVRPRA